MKRQLLKGIFCWLSNNALFFMFLVYLEKVILDFSVSNALSVLGLSIFWVASGFVLVISFVDLKTENESTEDEKSFLEESVCKH